MTHYDKYLWYLSLGGKQKENTKAYRKQSFRPILRFNITIIANRGVGKNKEFNFQGVLTQKIHHHIISLEILPFKHSDKHDLIEERLLR